MRMDKMPQDQVMTSALMTAEKVGCRCRASRKGRAKDTLLDVKLRRCINTRRYEMTRDLDLDLISAHLSTSYPRLVLARDEPRPRFSPLIGPLRAFRLVSTHFPLQRIIVLVLSLLLDFLF